MTLSRSKSGTSTVQTPEDNTHARVMSRGRSYRRRGIWTTPHLLVLASGILGALVSQTRNTKLNVLNEF